MIYTYKINRKLDIIKIKLDKKDKIKNYNK